MYMLKQTRVDFDYANRAFHAFKLSDHDNVIKYQYLVCQGEVWADR